MSKRSFTVAIVGGGLAGLSAAFQLEMFGYSPTIYEASQACGGRVKTDRVEGFLLDHGYHQVLSTYDVLFSLCSPKEFGLAFKPSGACFQKGGSWNLLLNPLANRKAWTRTIPFFWDILKLGKLYLKKSEKLLETPLCTLFEELQFSPSFIHKVLHPFFAGVFLDPDLATSSAAFKHLLGFFLRAKGGLPKEGIQALPLGIQKKLRQTRIHTQAVVEHIDKGTLMLQSGEEVCADAILLALSAHDARRFLPALPPMKSCATSCCYLSLDQGILRPTPYIYLVEKGQGPINNFSLLNYTQPTYAPRGKDLVSATVLDRDWQQSPDLEQAVMDHLSALLGVPSSRWNLLKTYHIPQALPDQSSSLFPPFSTYKVPGMSNLYVCGELVDPPSFQDAVLSGMRAAEALHQSLENSCKS